MITKAGATKRLAALKGLLEDYLNHEALLPNQAAEDAAEDAAQLKAENERLTTKLADMTTQLDACQSLYGDTQNRVLRFDEENRVLIAQAEQLKAENARLSGELEKANRCNAEDVARLSARDVRLTAELTEARKQPVTLLPVVTFDNIREFSEWRASLCNKREDPTFGTQAHWWNTLFLRNFREAAIERMKPTLDVEALAEDVWRALYGDEAIKPKLLGAIRGAVRKHVTDAPAKPAPTLTWYGGKLDGGELVYGTGRIVATIFARPVPRSSPDREIYTHAVAYDVASGPEEYLGPFGVTPEGRMDWAQAKEAVEAIMRERLQRADAPDSPNESQLTSPFTSDGNPSPSMNPKLDVMGLANSIANTMPMMPGVGVMEYANAIYRYIHGTKASVKLVADDTIASAAEQAKRETRRAVGAELRRHYNSGCHVLAFAQKLERGE
jgi:hypothetical protein